jgi:iron uptake system EfeUOB component EfeO/EfeM
MGYFGTQDKRSIVYLLDNGLASLKDDVKEKAKDSKTLWNEFNQLEKVLYGEGDKLLSMTNKIRFEKRLNTIRKMLEKPER